MQTDNFKKHTNTNPLQKFFIDNFYKNLLKLLKDNHDIESILDVGCGEGFTLKKLKDNNIGKSLVGIEYLDASIELGKKYNSDIEIKKGSIYALPYKDNSFDLVICTEVLEHLDNPEDALKELNRVTRKYSLLTVPNEPFFMLSNLLRGKNVSRFGNDIEHINHWTMFSFTELVKKYFNIDFVKYPYPWIMILASKK